jgi:LmbE family N-acetylglucosaminyl deacetylase
MADEGGLLAIFAHPDDEASGTMAVYRDRGLPVTMLCATRGEVGQIAPDSGIEPGKLGEARAQELRDACAIVGVTDVRFLDYRDSGMRGTPDNDDPRSLNQADPQRVEEEMVRVIRDVRPAGIITWDPTGGYGHPDHIAVHHQATRAFHAAADPARFPNAGAPWKAKALAYMVFPIEEYAKVFEEVRAHGVNWDVPGDEDLASLEQVPANCAIDCTPFLDAKLRGLRAHKTQMGDWGPLLKMPEELQRRFFGREWFHRATPPVAEGAILEDLFAGLS